MASSRKRWAAGLPILLAGCLSSLAQARDGHAPVPDRARGSSAAERRLVESVDVHQAAGLQLLEQAVNINSGTLNRSGVREVGRLLAPRFEALGFETRWVDGAAWERAGHLIAVRRPPHAKLKVLLIGHLDTVFEADSPFQRFEPASDSTAHGPGVIDMKGGDVVMLLALGALADAKLLDRLAFTVVLSGDEEKAGTPYELSRRDLREAAEWADVAIGFEDGAGDPRTAVIARRGATGWRLATHGKPAHSSLIFRSDIGSGAIYEAARILAAFQDSLSHEPLLTLNPGVILGGTSVTFDAEQARGSAFGKSNVIAESTSVAGDLRTISLEQRERTRNRMRGIVADHLPHTTAEITFEDGYPPLAPSDGNRRLLALFDQASRDLGYGPVTAVDPARAGAADISFTEGLVEMALDGVGLMGTGGHTVGETADLRTLAMNAKRVALTLSRLADNPQQVQAPH